MTPHRTEARLRAELLEPRLTPASVAGAVFDDVDGNGVRDPADAGVAGVRVELDAGADGTTDATADTDAVGNYSFAGLATGTYRVRVVVPTARISTTTGEQDFTLAAADDVTGVDFGGFRTVTISGSVFYDRNQSLARDAGEPALPGVTLTLDTNLDDVPETSTTTDAAGVYAFPGLGPAIYRVRVVTPAGYVPTGFVLGDRPAASGAVDPGPAFALFTPPPPGLIGTRKFAAGACAGGGPVVRLFNPDGTERFTRYAFAAGFTGGVRTAAADFDGDGIADLVAGTGPGATTQVRVLSGADGRPLFAVQPFEAAFTGGVYIAAGDLTGDGTPDLVVCPDQGGGPRVLVYRGGDFAVVASFLGIDDPNFRGGGRPAVGDLSGDGRTDLVVAAGFGGGPRVAAFDGTSLGGRPSPRGHPTRPRCFIPT